MKDYKRLDLIMLQEPTGCNYRYLVKKDFGAYTAFRTYKALRAWMRDRGLAARFDHKSGRGRATMTLHGSFDERMIMDQAEWDAIRPIGTVPFLSNGSYTVAKITQEGDTRVLTYLNPNVRTRPILDDAATTKALDAGINPLGTTLPRTDHSARDILLRMVANFPGLYDCETAVDGADLVDWVTNEIHALKPDGELRARAVNGSPDDNNEEGQE